MCGQAEEAARLNRTSEEYTIVRKISGKSSTTSANLVNKRNDERPNDKDELLSEWASYFKDLLNIPNNGTSLVEILPANNDLIINDDDFTLDELLKAIKIMKPNKSPGIDYITTEALKYGGNDLQSALLSICNSILNGQDPPHQWKENMIVPIPKKPSKSMSDFRGISLMSIVAKAYNRMILNRIYDPIDEVLRPFQAGFRKSRSCAEQIHILRRIIEAYHQRQLPIIATFIDFKKAFDSVDREAMWKILRSYGIPQKVVNAIATIYSNSKSRVRLGDKMSEAFNVGTRVLQGDTLAPVLFVIVLDYVLKQTNPSHGLQTDIQTILPDLDFADDIVAFDSDEAAAENHLKNIEQAGQRVGLSINRKKTKIFLVNHQLSNPAPPTLANLEVVEDFKYLGANIASSYKDFKQRRGIAWSQFWKLDKIWRSSQISNKLKLRLFDSLILSILLYNAETWTLSEQFKNQLNSFATSCYRIMLNIKRIDRVSNQQILNIMKRKNLAETVIIRQLRSLGHWLRKPADSIINKYALYTTNEGRGRRGRPRLTYVKQMQDLTGMGIRALKRKAANRKIWKEHVVGRFDTQAPD